MSTVVRVNGQSFDYFKQLDISRSLDHFAGECRIMVTEQINDQSFLLINDQVDILLDGFQRIHGYAEKTSDSESSDSHDVSFTIREMSDLIDSTIPDNLKTITGVSAFSSLINIALKGLELTGIKVIDQNYFRMPETLKAGEVGQKTLDYLLDYARMVGAILSTDGKGNIIIYKLGTLNPTMLINQRNGTNNNILDSSLDIDYSSRYYHYLFRSQGGIDQQWNDGNNYTVHSYKGEAFDEEIRTTRRLELKSETPMNSDQLAVRASQESNLRRARSVTYTVRVNGFSANSTPWEIGQLVKVNDEKKKIKGVFLIKEISMSSSSGGEITELKLTYPDAYGVNAVLNDDNTVTVSSNYLQTPQNWKKVRSIKGTQTT